MLQLMRARAGERISEIRAYRVLAEETARGDISLTYF